MASDSPPTVSAIIPVYKSARYVAEAMASVFDQTYQDWEMVLVDDGSPDNSSEIIAEQIRQHPDKRITYIRQENRGIAGARNTGIRNSSGKYLALLDADDKWAPRRLDEGVRVLDSHPEVGLVHSQAERIGPDGELRPRTMFPVHLPDQSGMIFEKLLLRKANIYALTTLFRRSCCDRVGMFDESKVLMGVDDRDLWTRIARYHQVAYIETPLAYWRIHENNYSGDNDRMMRARVAMLDGFRKQRAIPPVLYRRCMSKVHKEMGDSLLYAGKFDDAVRQYVTSIRRWPLEAPSYLNCVKALLHRRPVRTDI
jgi:glycosyltransferase involved in cell wall biosynthesis